MRPKVFFIGFNKTGTTSLHVLFQQSGYKSFHLKGATGPLAKEMRDNLKQEKPILENNNIADAYSDMTYAKTELIEGCRYFKELHEEYPDAYFILQIRDVDNWIRSRKKHKANYLGRYMRFTNITNKNHMTEKWRKDFHKHYQQVTEYFSGNPKFLVFDIEKDPIEKLIRHVSKDYTLHKRFWTVRNKTLR